MDDYPQLARPQHFIGRRGHIEALDTALSASQFPFAQLVIHGPGGVGKTALLGELAFLCHRHKIRPVYLEGGDIEPLPEAFEAALKSALGIRNGTSAREHIQAASGRFALLIDAYEALLPLEDWLWKSFLPGLPANVLSVIAARHAPATAQDPRDDREDSLYMISLGNLSIEESISLLSKRGLSGECIHELIAEIGGHPLALNLASDLFALNGLQDTRPRQDGNAITSLFRRFLRQAPTPAHLTAIQVCALARRTTTTLLEAVLESASGEQVSPQSLMDWLHGLSFIHLTAEGLYPHDIARQVVSRELRRHASNQCADLQKRAHAWYTSQIESLEGETRQRLLLDLIYLYRDNPAIGPFFELQADSAMPDKMQLEDVERLCTLVEQCEGKTSSYVAAHWFTRQPQGVTIWRNNEREVAGFLAAVSLDRYDSEDWSVDPALREVLGYLERRVRLQPGEKALLFRFWLAADACQAAALFQKQIFRTVAKQYLSTPRLAYTFFPCADPEEWQPILDYASLSLIPEVDFEIDGRRYGIYGHDWRHEPPAVWIGRLAHKHASLEIEQGDSL